MVFLMRGTKAIKMTEEMQYIVSDWFRIRIEQPWYPQGESGYLMAKVLLGA